MQNSPFSVEPLGRLDHTDFMFPDVREPGNLEGDLSMGTAPLDCLVPPTSLDFNSSPMVDNTGLGVDPFAFPDVHMPSPHSDMSNGSDCENHSYASSEEMMSRTPLANQQQSPAPQIGQMPPSLTNVNMFDMGSMSVSSNSSGSPVPSPCTAFPVPSPQHTRASSVESEFSDNKSAGSVESRPQKKRGTKRKANQLKKELLPKEKPQNLSHLNKRDRNKISAAKYRKRRKIYVENLETKVEELSTQCTEQTEKVRSLEAENKVMKDQVQFLKKLLSLRGAMPSLPKAAGAMMFVLFSFFLLASPSTLNLSPQQNMLAIEPTDVSVMGRKGRTLLTVDELNAAGCECKGLNIPGGLAANETIMTSPLQKSSTSSGMVIEEIVDTQVVNTTSPDAPADFVGYWPGASAMPATH